MNSINFSLFITFMRLSRICKIDVNVEEFSIHMITSKYLDTLNTELY